MKRKPQAAPSTLAGALSGAFSVAVGHLSGLDWDLSAVDWPEAFNWLIGSSGLGAFVGFATSVESPKESELLRPDVSDWPLGLRNNNPGNLRPSTSYRWRGEISANSGFVVFDTATNGLRAMAKNLSNQQRLHGLTTIRSIIRKYAPESENDTENYINFVSRRMATHANDDLDLSNSDVLVAMMRPMIMMENGVQPFSDEQLHKAVDLI